MAALCNLKFLNHNITRQLYLPLVRHLNLQEYRSKEIMAKHSINVQQFRIASSVEEAKSAASSLKVKEYVIKAQILAGGRGKGVFSNGFKVAIVL